ncbi:MAG TPA: YjjG family noncanonical pyrimidine nucleotidase [Chitinophagaceae bacterium]|nr:YjjG family noncanonical pyrimidine nucleotidase [Chitinophagaceae bacterium]
MKYRHLFFDLDHTLWDFEANAKATLETLYDQLQLKGRGVDDFERFYRQYLVHNEQLWARYRNGEIRQDELRVRRMRMALLEFRIGDEVLAAEMSTRFLELLPTRTILFPHTREILDYLTGRGYALHLITNGFEATQHSKLRYSGLAGYFRQVVTSEGSNSLKPSREIFDYALNRAGARASESIMLGDSLEVDIQGAMNAGMDQVYVNHLQLPAPIRPTYTVHSLKELEKIF